MSFEKFSEYRTSSFSKLNDRIRDEPEQQRFIERWRQKYATSFKNAAPGDGYLWSIRAHKALKSVFASATMYEEALIAKEAKSWTSFYFLSYYSLFNALISCVYFVPEETMKSLSEMTHSKLANVFRSNFATARRGIIDPKIWGGFFIMKYLREYYSYQMPPNHFLYGHKDTMKPDECLPDYLTACFQLASLLSELVEKASTGHHKWPKRQSRVSIYRQVNAAYQLANSLEHPLLKCHLLHHVDRIRIDEIVKYPGPVCFVNEFEHFSDEFGMYEGAEMSQYRDGREINPAKIVYAAISGS